MRIPFPHIPSHSFGPFRPFDMCGPSAIAIDALYFSERICAFVDGRRTNGFFILVPYRYSFPGSRFSSLEFKTEYPDISRWFDALDVSKAVIAAELLSCATLFSLTRLEGIPRSTPIIHAL